MTRIDLDAIEATAKRAMLLRGGELNSTTYSRRWRVVASDSESMDAVATCDTDHDDGFAYDCCSVVAETAHELLATHVAGMDPATALALVAELRAARTVVALAPGHRHPVDRRCALAESLAAYDAVIGGAQP